MVRHTHIEKHRTQRIGWLRAAVLGANDGIVSTTSLVIGVAVAEVSSGNVLVAGITGSVAGAMSMAAGEYVSVSSQADTENADLARERRELLQDPELELKELQAIYVDRGLKSNLAKQVAEQLMSGNALAAQVGNANLLKGILRITFWGILAMGHRIRGKNFRRSRINRSPYKNYRLSRFP
ncbi:VIT domain protein [Leptospira fainei serovar Hurstbridge str. BUT 6]|uniref:VIT domain protein n=1 Tax=Leptospira fainei serovar Hurstbridge str. BUT 6 TaxID=1193011 RepID=S3W5Z5_9LEPT|nr:VIT1/CCC1 transporter family protein [Leptospira fainei]EPG75567.1 VIT domain protein [Leptospira fainei serovar Hurstbridge str. BUT 6]